MSTLDIILPDPLRAFVDDQVAQRGYRNASEFVQALIEAEQLRDRRQDIENQLLEAADGPFTDWTDDDITDIERLGTRLIERRKVR